MLQFSSRAKGCRPF